MEGDTPLWVALLLLMAVFGVAAAVFVPRPPRRKQNPDGREPTDFPVAHRARDRDGYGSDPGSFDAG